MLSPEGLYSTRTISKTEVIIFLFPHYTNDGCGITNDTLLAMKHQVGLDGAVGAYQL